MKLERVIQKFSFFQFTNYAVQRMLIKFIEMACTFIIDSSKIYMLRNVLVAVHIYYHIFYHNQFNITKTYILRHI